MFGSFAEFLGALVRPTLALSASTAVVGLLFAWLKPASARLRRAVWLMVLLQGVVLLRIMVLIPWYEPGAKARPPVVRTDTTRFAETDDARSEVATEWTPASVPEGSVLIN